MAPHMKGLRCLGCCMNCACSQGKLVVCLPQNLEGCLWSFALQVLGDWPGQGGPPVFSQSCSLPGRTIPEHYNSRRSPNQINNYLKLKAYRGHPDVHILKAACCSGAALGSLRTLLQPLITHDGKMHKRQGTQTLACIQL